MTTACYYPWRRPMCLGVIALVLATGAFYFAWSRLPQPPRIELDGLDPAVAEAIVAARDRVLAQPKSAAAWGTLAMTLFAHDVYAESLECLKLAQNMDPADPRWPYYQGVMLAAERPEAALGPLRRSAQLGGGLSPTLRLAEGFLVLDRIDEAEKEFRDALTLDPDHPRVHLGLGQIAVRRDAAADAIKHLQRAAAMPLTQKAATTALAELHLKRNQVKEAEALRQKAAAMPVDPAWPDPMLADIVALQKGVPLHVQRADYFLRHGEAAKGAQMLQQLLAEQPAADVAHLKLAQGYLRLGKVPDAERALHEALRLRPDVAEGHFLLGITRLMRDDHQGAEPPFRKAIALRPNHALAHFNLGLCLQSRGDAAGARDALENALRYRPHLAEAHVSLAEVVLDQGDATKARSHLQDALRLKPGNEAATKLLEKIK